MSTDLITRRTVLKHNGATLTVIPYTRSRSVRARRAADGTIRISVPYAFPLQSLADMAQRIIDRLDALTPPGATAIYTADTRITLASGTTVTFATDTGRRGALLAVEKTGYDSMTLHFGRDIDFTRHSVAITRTLMHIAASDARSYMPPRIASHCKRLGLTTPPTAISSGLRTLGTCRRDRRIAISAACMFLPPHLIDYVICHELAHLSEMNHSARFHAICNRYLDGREKALEAELRAFKWPIAR